MFKDRTQHLMTHSSIRGTTALFFFISGFCGLLYQVVWLRLAFTHFGINTPVLSVVLSVFMAGLALGSWLGGRLAGTWPENKGAIPLRFYGTIELLTGLGAFMVPLLFEWGAHLLLPLGNADSNSYLFSSALVLLFSLLPWCFFMGTTFPFMTAFLKTVYAGDEGFSFLYNANVQGAMTGVLFTAVILIECLGFQGTLRFGAFLNALIGLASFAMSQKLPGAPAPPETSPVSPIPSTEPSQSIPYLSILFTSGFVCMALEVVWTRAYTVVLNTFVYSFASLLFSYLLATFAGSWFYRWHLKRGKTFPVSPLLGAAFAFTFLPFILNDARLSLYFIKPLAGLMPMCAVWGYLTPKLVDQSSKGIPRGVGKAYAANVLGCVLGPLAASYLLLPEFSCRQSMILLSLPIGLFFFYSILDKTSRNLSTLAWTSVSIVLFITSFNVLDYEEGYRYADPKSIVFRDYAASSVSRGSGMERILVVNGIKVTGLVPSTKIMAHLPLVLLSRPPKSALDICFGMGTTFRSLMSWGIPTTAVELVPGVIKSFPFFHADAQALASNPNARLVVDDGRRFLQRTAETFDLITIDPPPPVEAAGSSLLYSTGFYELAKKRLAPGGLLQQWLPAAEVKIIQAVTRSIFLSFPYVRVFGYPNGIGYHFIASMSPIPDISADEMLRKMPASARRDMTEWPPIQDAKNLLEFFITQEIDPRSLLGRDSGAAVTDDRPYNEYFLVRRFMDWWNSGDTFSYKPISGIF